jgi:hypothetical protein
MPTLFEVLYDVALELRADPLHADLTHHHNPDRTAVEASLQGAITTLQMPDEEGHVSTWRIARVFCRNFFCRNFVNRAQPAVRPDLVKRVLDDVEATYPTDEERVTALPAAALQCFDGGRTAEMVAAIAKFTSPAPVAALGDVSYLAWVSQRSVHWQPKVARDLVADELLADIALLSGAHSPARIKGMGLPVTANFFADLGLPAFAKPDLHVVPIIGAVTFDFDETAVFRSIVRIVQTDCDRYGSRVGRFAWLNAVGGLMPRHLDRLIYLIGSDNFRLDGSRNTRQAPARRALMVRRLVDSGIIRSQYWEELGPASSPSS